MVVLRLNSSIFNSTISARRAGLFQLNKAAANTTITAINLYLFKLQYLRHILFLAEQVEGFHDPFAF